MSLYIYVQIIFAHFDNTLITPAVIVLFLLELFLLHCFYVSIISFCVIQVKKLIGFSATVAAKVGSICTVSDWIALISRKKTIIYVATVKTPIKVHR